MKRSLLALVVLSCGTLYATEAEPLSSEQRTPTKTKIWCEKFEKLSKEHQQEVFVLVQLTKKYVSLQLKEELQGPLTQEEKDLMAQVLLLTAFASTPVTGVHESNELFLDFLSIFNDFNKNNIDAHSKLILSNLKIMKKSKKCLKCARKILTQNEDQQTKD